MQREKKNEVEIQAALDQSKRAMRFGDTFGAVSALEAVKQVIQRLLRGNAKHRYREDQHPTAVAVVFLFSLINVQNFFRARTLSLLFFMVLCTKYVL